MSNKLRTTIRGLTPHLQPDEQVRLTIPGIWVNGRMPQQPEQQESQGQNEQRGSSTCDIILTNQRLLGYAHIRFPRERLFLESFPLNTITAVSLRQKSYEPLFHELLISDGQRRAYIRSSRQKIEQLYAALRSTHEYTPSNAATEPTQQEDNAETPPAASAQPTTIYGRQDVRRTFERSPLGVTLLFVGGLLLEIIGILLWAATQSIQIGLPLCIAGFVSVVTATVQRRRHRL